MCFSIQIIVIGCPTYWYPLSTKVRGWIVYKYPFQLFLITHLSLPLLFSGGRVPSRIIMVLDRTPSPPPPPPPMHQCTYQIHNWHSHWWPRVEESYRFWSKSEKPKWPLAPILWKYDEKACTLYNLIKNAPIKFIFDVATDILSILAKIGIQNGRFSPIFPTFPHLSPPFPTYSNFCPLFPTFRHFLPLFPTFRNFSPLFTTFRHFSPLFPFVYHFSLLFPTFCHFSPLLATFPNFSQLLATFCHFSPLFPTFPALSPTFSHFPHFLPLFTTFPHY